MRNFFTYFLLLVSFAWAREVLSQDCNPNMLFIPDASSYAVIPNPKNISLPGAFTIEFWAESSSFAAHSGLIEQLNKGDTGAFSIGFTAGDSIIVSLRLNNGITNITTSNISNIQNWNHYAVTFTPKDSIRIYINGILNTSQKTNASNLFASSDSILIAHRNLSGATFTGNIDELRIWSIAKTSAEIFSAMKKTLTGKEAGLKAYYSFDDDPGSPNIHDFTGNNNEGIVISSAKLTASTSPITGTTASYMLASKESRIIFPDLLCASTADTIIHVFNRGSETVNIDPVAFQSGTIFSATTSGFPLPPDSTHIGIISIHALALNPGFYRDTLIIPSTTVCGGILRIPVELRVQKISIAFQDTVFQLRDLLPCDLPLNPPGQTTLYNTGTKAVTVNALLFSIPSGINIISPATPFTINPGQSIPIIFNILPGASGVINTTLTATINECSRNAKIVFIGKRITPQFQIPNSINFSSLHLPPVSISVDTTIFLKNSGTSNLSFNPPLTLIGGPGFKLLSPSSGLAFIKPDSSVPIKIRFKTSECGTFETALHFQDQLDCSIDTLVPISITVLGPDVSPVNNLIDLGASCGTHDTLITFVNRSGLPVILGKPLLSADSIFSFSNLNLPKSLSPGDSFGIILHFAPGEPGKYFETAKFSLSPCGDEVIQLQGLLGIGQIALSDSIVDFGSGCDFTPGIRKLAITNQCGRTITVTDTKIEGSQRFSVITPSLPFVMANNESKEITVQFVPQQLGILEQARINLFDSGCFVTRFTVSGVREHAHVQWDHPGFVEFGTICPGRKDTLGINLQNLGFGNDTISSLLIKDASVFSAENTNGSVISHGASKEFFITFSPKDTGDFLGVLEVFLSPCGDTTWLPLHGIGGPPSALSVSDSILDFGTIKFATTDSLCTILQNPSCIGLPVTLDSLHSNTNSRFGVSQSSAIRLPDSVIAGDPLTLCFVFMPDSIGTFTATDTIKIGDQKKILTLRGAAGVSNLKFSPQNFDFGDVLKGTSDTLKLSIINRGSYPASLVIVNSIATDFTITPHNQNIGGNSADTDKIVFSPTSLGLQTTMIIFSWENNRDTIFLRGRGVQPGLQFTSSLLDFTKVRVTHDSVIAINIKNSLVADSIIVDSITIIGKFSAAPIGHQVIAPQRSIAYIITYSPNAEMIDSGTLVIHTENSGDAILPLRGEGVEAHLILSTTSINFGNVGLGQTQIFHLKISDSGGYPLSITRLQNKVTNFTTATASPFIIAPNSSIDEVVSFSPLRAIAYFDTLHIDADAPEKTASIFLQGKGAFSPLGFPQVSYNIPDRQAKVGDLIDIPISIDGKDLPFFDLDSFRVDLSYDPHLVFFHDTITTSGTLSSGFTMKFERFAHDSIIRITGSGNSIIPFASRLFILQAEALLGPVDSTRIFISSSNPINTADLLSSSGLFVVTDCGNYRGGVITKGNYSVSNVTPNPATSTAHIDYEIGLTGRVHLDLYDALGRHITTIIDDNETKGNHTAKFSTEGVPSGEYIYVLKSLDYENRGTLIILN